MEVKREHLFIQVMEKKTLLCISKSLNYLYKPKETHSPEHANTIKSLQYMIMCDV